MPRPRRPYSEAVWRYYFGGKSQQAIAAEDGLPLGTVKSRLHDARIMLREAMSEMGKKLDGLEWKSAWTSHIGCVRGCMEFLGLGVSEAWVFGGTGHAFVINVHPGLCPSGPTAWATYMLHELAPNIGCAQTIVHGDKSQGDLFAGAQKEAWDKVRAAIDAGLPCYGWELDIPEFYVINGYDDVGYLYSGPSPTNSTGPKPWRELGDSGIGCVEVYKVEACSPAPDDVVVKQAIAKALRHAEAPPEWVYPQYRSGPKAFEAWADALAEGKAGRFGLGYNAAVWEECRRNAVAFLREARQRLAGRSDGLFDEAIEHYTSVHSKLNALVVLYPFDAKTGSEEVRSPEGAELMRAAAQAEAQGLEVLRQLAQAL